MVRGRWLTAPDAIHRNFNTNLRYLNLSGNKRLEIKPDTNREKRKLNSQQKDQLAELSDFSSLNQLRILGLMDVTISAQANIPEEGDEDL